MAFPISSEMDIFGVSDGGDSADDAEAPDGMPMSDIIRVMIRIEVQCLLVMLMFLLGPMESCHFDYDQLGLNIYPLHLKAAAELLNDAV